MVTLEGSRAARFELSTRACHFLLEVLPLRHPHSAVALREFVQFAATSRLCSWDRDSVFLRVLVGFEPQVGGMIPSLVDRYLRIRQRDPDPLESFQACVQTVLRYRGVTNPHVQHAVAVVLERYSDPHFGLAEVAESIGVTPSSLCSSFKTHTGWSFSDYLRQVRLDRAAAALTTSPLTVKEVWAAVGYNDRATFNHHFRRRFGLTPTRYRVAAFPPCPTTAPLPADRSCSHSSSNSAGTKGRRVLIVEDDQGTRETFACLLRLAGYTVQDASSGREGLECARRKLPDAVLLDFHLGDLDGFEFLSKLRQDRAWFDPPALLFTADWELEDRRKEAHALGAAVMTKLTDFTNVERVLASLCTVRGEPTDGTHPLTLMASRSNLIELRANGAKGCAR